MKSDPEMNPILSLIKTVVDILVSILGVVTLLYSLYTTDRNQLVVYLILVYAVIMVTLFIFIFSKKTLKGKKVYRFPSYLRYPSYAFAFLFTGGFLFISISLGQNVNEPSTFFSREKMESNPCYFGNAPDGEIWEIVVTGQDGSGLAKMLLMTRDPIIVDEISLVVDEVFAPLDMSQYQFQEDPKCIPPGGGPIQELNLQLLRLNLENTEYKLVPEENGSSALLPYQLDENEALWINLPFTIDESGGYTFHLRAKISSYQNGDIDINSQSLIYRGLSLNKTTFESISFGTP